MQPVSEIHVFRAVASLMVVALHVTAPYMVFSPPNSLAFHLGLALNQLARVSLPLFVFTSGFGLFYGYGPAEEFSPRKYISRRLNRVFVPYATWTLVYLTLRKGPATSPSFSGLPFRAVVAEYFQWLFWKNIETPLWFILMLFQLYALFPFIRRWVAGTGTSPAAATTHTVVFLIVLVYLRYFMHPIGFPPVDFLQTYYAETPLGWYYYFIIGGIAATRWDSIQKARFDIPQLTVANAVAGALVVGESYWGALRHGQGYLQRYGPIRPAILLYTVVSIPLTYAVGRKVMAGRFRHGIELLSRYSFGVYFVHPQILAALRLLFNRFFVAYTGRTLYLGLLLILVTGLSLLLCYLIDRTPLRRLLLGLGPK